MLYIFRILTFYWTEFLQDVLFSKSFLREILLRNVKKPLKLVQNEIDMGGGQL